MSPTNAATRTSSHNRTYPHFMRRRTNAPWWRRRHIRSNRVSAPPRAPKHRRLRAAVRQPCGTFYGRADIRYQRSAAGSCCPAWGRRLPAYPRSRRRRPPPWRRCSTERSLNWSRSRGVERRDIIRRGRAVRSHTHSADATFPHADVGARMWGEHRARGTSPPFIPPRAGIARVPARFSPDTGGDAMGTSRSRSFSPRSPGRHGGRGRPIPRRARGGLRRARSRR